MNLRTCFLRSYNLSLFVSSRHPYRYGSLYLSSTLVISRLKSMSKSKLNTCSYCNDKSENILIFAEKYENMTLNNCLSDIDLNSEIAVVIGPEGGISDKEVNIMNDNNFIPVSLGPRILRTEVAPTYAMAAISYELEE